MNTDYTAKEIEFAKRLSALTETSPARAELIIYVLDEFVDALAKGDEEAVTRMNTASKIIAEEGAW